MDALQLPERTAADQPTDEVYVAGGTDSDAAAGPDAATQVVARPALRIAKPYPAVGEHFQGFEILSELGRGAMGRVFLARQQSPTERVVVLKMGHHLSAECQKLAKLQHPNVVPVYSFHEFDEMQAVCMPYRGPLTLGHLVARLRSERFQTLDGRALTTMIEECRKDRRQTVATASLGGTDPGTPAADVVLPDADVPPFPGLRGLSFVDAALTLIRQVVDGLRAAHAEKIVHSDLKPANVLIADDGCAQLIDFGVAFDPKDRAGDQVRLGGTRPYMSPEQLQSFLAGALEHDERSDLYAAGALLYELLTGRLPFPSAAEATPEDIRKERDYRFQPPKSPRAVNPQVPAAVASIIDKCLAPRAADRYQTAADLLDDLDRQLARRPLKFAANVSPRELVTKFVTRNRILLAAVGFLGTAGAVGAGFWQRDAQRTDEIRRLELISAAEPFAKDVEEAEFTFALADNDPAQRERAWYLARRALNRFGAWDNPTWFEGDTFKKLTAERQEGVRRRVAGVLLVLANAQAQQATRHAGDDRADLLADAAEWNRRAELAADGRAVWVQRAFLARLGGDAEAAAKYATHAETFPGDAAAAVLEGRQLMTEGHTHAAVKTFDAAVKADPKQFWAVFFAASCRQALGQYTDALAGYDVCAALRPGFFGTEFNRGLSRLRMGHVEQAEAAFGKALDARPGWADAHFHRAIAREGRKAYAAAIDDLNAALRLGYTPTAVYLVRSRVAGLAGDAAGAKADFAEAVQTVPTDERGWLVRAQAQLHRNPDAALADYDAALALNPSLAPALHGKAYILGLAQRNAEALPVLTRMIELAPDSADAWGGRGVAKARLNDRDGALADGRAALRLSNGPVTRYQVAGIYALTSRTHPEDRREALSLLDGALRDGFGFDLLDKDPELDPLRHDAEFQRTVDAARKYRAALKN